MFVCMYRVHTCNKFYYVNCNKHHYYSIDICQFKYQETTNKKWWIRWYVSFYWSYLFVVCWQVELSKFQLKVLGKLSYAYWTYLWQCCILSFTQYYNNFYFYCIIINWNFIWNIALNNGVFAIHAIKRIACMNTVHTFKHNWSLQSFSQDYWPSFLHHLCCVC